MLHVRKLIIVFALIILSFFSAISYGETQPVYGISSNPATSDIIVGNGDLGKLLNIKQDTGFRLGGLWVANSNQLFHGGDFGKRFTSNNLVILNLSFDSDKASSWKGGKFDVQFLQFNGVDTNGRAGSVQGFNSISVTAPFDRSELYQIWYRQNFLDKKIVVRIGKLVPAYDFDNVVKPLQVEKSYQIPSTTGLLYTPVFVNPTTLSFFPGYYNSAYGITLNIAPSKHYYWAIGAYDGNLATGSQTGLNGPHFTGHYIYITEAGVDWELPGSKPGKAAIGVWRQTGKLTTSDDSLAENGAEGLYSFGWQKVWQPDPGIDDKGVLVFYQFGINDSKTVALANEFAGLGVTVFGFFRQFDSFGFGTAWAWLNTNVFNRSSELMFQIYYQFFLARYAFLSPALTYIPTPGASKDLPQVWAGTLQLVFLF